jgi:hypothetical protein
MARGRMVVPVGMGMIVQIDAVIVAVVMAKGRWSMVMEQFQ